MGVMEISIYNSTRELASEDAGSNGLDEDLFLWQRHIQILTGLNIININLLSTFIPLICTNHTLSMCINFNQKF